MYSVVYRKPCNVCVCVCGWVRVCVWVLRPLLVCVGSDFLGYKFSVTASSRIVVCSVFVSHLSARLPPTVLSSLNESRVPVHPYDAVVQPGAIYVSHRILGVFTQIVFDEAEAARRFLELVQTHHDASDVAAPGEQLVDLLLGGVKRKIAHVQGCGELQEFVLFVARSLYIYIKFEVINNKCI